MKKYLGKTVAATLFASVGLFVGAQADADTYEIQAGDSFFSIAENLGVDPYKLAADNGMSIYDLILPGQKIQVKGYTAPTAAKPVASNNSGAAYTVQEGDSFNSIAAAHGVDAASLASANGLTLDSVIYIGQSLKVPAIASATKEVTASPVKTDSYKIPGYEYEPGINYPVGQCTWGVQKVSGWAGDWWGNAADWAKNAAKDGYRVGQQPAVGAIAVWSHGAGGFGHVAYVTDVRGDGYIQVLEANFNGHQTIGNHRGWFNPAKTNEGSAVYIYPY